MVQGADSRGARCRTRMSRRDAGMLDRGNLVFAEHGRTDSCPIATGTIERAAEQLDLALAMSEV